MFTCLPFNPSKQWWNRVHSARWCLKRAGSHFRLFRLGSYGLSMVALGTPTPLTRTRFIAIMLDKNTLSDFCVYLSLLIVGVCFDNSFNSLTFSVTEVRWGLSQPLCFSRGSLLAALLWVRSLTSLAGNAHSSFVDFSAGYLVLSQPLLLHFGFLLFAAPSWVLWLVSAIKISIESCLSLIFLYCIWLAVTLSSKLQ